MIICPECFERLPDDARYCGKCKVELVMVEDKLQTCPNCKSRVPRSYDRCPSCGYPFAEKSDITTTSSTLRMTTRNTYMEALQDIGKISVISFLVLLILAFLAVLFITGLGLRENMTMQLIVFSMILVLGFGGMHFLFGLILVERFQGKRLSKKEASKEAGIFFVLIFGIGGLGVLQLFLGVLVPVLFFTGVITLEAGLLFALAQFLYKQFWRGRGSWTPPSN